MKRNILVVMFAMILACAFSFTFTGCKKAEKPAPVVTEEKKPDAAATTGTDKAADLKKEAGKAAGEAKDTLVKKAVDAGKGAASDAASKKMKGKVGF